MPRYFVVSRSPVLSPRRASAGERGLAGQNEAPNTLTLGTAYDIARRQAIPAGIIPAPAHSPGADGLVADPLSWPATPKRRIILFSMKRIASRSRFARRSAIE